MVIDGRWWRLIDAWRLDASGEVREIVMQTPWKLSYTELTEMWERELAALRGKTLAEAYQVIERVYREIELAHEAQLHRLVHG